MVCSCVSFPLLPPTFSFGPFFKISFLSFPGDAENDVEMLRLAGVGVCVGNASPPAKAAARYVAPTNADDGSAVAMEQLLRNKKPGSLEE